MAKLRVGIVNYLNSKPLAWGFLKGRHDDLFAPSTHPPARVAELLAAGELDVGLIPSIEVQRIPGLRVMPGPVRGRDPRGAQRAAGVAGADRGDRTRGARREQPHLGGAGAHRARGAATACSREYLHAARADLERHAGARPTRRC